LTSRVLNREYWVNELQYFIYIFTTFLVISSLELDILMK